jgi:predicted DNA-binding WGR domain protein
VRPVGTNRLVRNRGRIGTNWQELVEVFASRPSPAKRLRRSLGRNGGVAIRIFDASVNKKMTFEDRRKAAIGCFPGHSVTNRAIQFANSKLGRSDRLHHKRTLAKNPQRRMHPVLADGRSRSRTQSGQRAGRLGVPELVGFVCA